MIKKIIRNFITAPLIRLAEKSAFRPGAAGLFLNPFYFARKGLHRAIRCMAGEIGGRTLDVGCGKKPYADLFRNSSEYLGLEIDSAENRRNKNAEFFYDGKRFPFESESFESVVTNQVFEHVFNPGAFLSEINRVLKPGGALLISVPFVWDEHEQPFDFARYSSFGLISVVEGAGFTVVRHKKTVNDASLIFQLIAVFIYKKFLTGNENIDIILTVALIAPFNIVGTLLGGMLPRNDDLYLDNVILARKNKNV